MWFAILFVLLLGACVYAAHYDERVARQLKQVALRFVAGSQSTSTRVYSSYDERGDDPEELDDMAALSPAASTLSLQTSATPGAQPEGQRLLSSS